jgi:hypothetical protein
MVRTNGLYRPIAETQEPPAPKPEKLGRAQRAILRVLEAERQPLNIAELARAVWGRDLGMPRSLYESIRRATSKLIDRGLLSSDRADGYDRRVWNPEWTDYRERFGFGDVISGRDVEARILYVLDWRERRYSEMVHIVGKAYPGRDVAVAVCRAIKRLHSSGKIERMKKYTSQGKVYEVIWRDIPPVVVKKPF